MPNEADKKQEYSSGSDESDDDDDDNDPRVAAMLPHAVPSHTTKTPRQVHVAEQAMIECFQKSMQAFSHADPGSLGLWKPPPLFPTMSTNDQDASVLVVADWQPASLPLPSWTTQPPPS